MAIVKNFWLQNQKKKLAGAVIYQAMGQTRSRELAASVANPRTVAQMEQRTRWANLVNFYRANASWMKYAYETKKVNQTEYNKFMSLNVPSARIYLPKSIASQGGCVVDAYQMTQGSLASIEITAQGDQFKSNINIGNSLQLVSTTTVAEFTQAVLIANPAMREGDQLSFIRLTQQVNSNSGVPFVVVRKYEVILNSNDFRPFFDFMPEDYIVNDGIEGGGVLAVMNSGNAGGFLLILSRTVGGKTYVSTQSIIVANNSALITQYSSAAARQAAIDSYGESAEPFLTSTTANENEQAAVTPSVVAVTVDGVARNVGEAFYPAGDLGGATVRVQLSQPAEGQLSEMSIKLVLAGQEATLVLTDTSLSGAIATGSIPDAFGAYENWAVSDIYAEIGDSSFRAPFLVPNEATIGGLE